MDRLMIIKNAWRAISDTIKFFQTPQKERRLAFYSQGSADWPHIIHLLKAALTNVDQRICYISSSTSDPGLEYQHENLLSFYVGDKFIRDYFFQNMEIDNLILTMPDIDRFQVKRSKHNINYIYIPHSLVSLHMIYRNCAFKNYDVIACAGPHHLEEIKILANIDNHRPQKFVQLGYPRLDHLSRTIKLKSKTQFTKKNKTIVLAPSWGANGIIESGLGYDIIKEILNLGYKIILRPHPQSVKFSQKQIARILASFDQDKNFKYESNMNDETTLFDADILISDWSGVALEFSFTTKRPVIFCDIPKKINNPNYKLVNLEPIEVKLRNQIGLIWQTDTSLADTIKKCSTNSPSNIEDLISKYIYNLGKSDQKFINFLKNDLGLEN